MATIPFQSDPSRSLTWALRVPELISLLPLLPYSSLVIFEEYKSKYVTPCLKSSHSFPCTQNKTQAHDHGIKALPDLTLQTSLTSSWALSPLSLSTQPSLYSLNTTHQPPSYLWALPWHFLSERLFLVPSDSSGHFLWVAVPQGPFKVMVPISLYFICLLYFIFSPYHCLKVSFCISVYLIIFWLPSSN